MLLAPQDWVLRHFLYWILNVLRLQRNCNRNRLVEVEFKLNRNIKRPIGKQDHYAAVFVVLIFKFHSDESVSIKPVEEPQNIRDRYLTF